MTNSNSKTVYFNRISEKAVYADTNRSTGEKFFRVIIGNVPGSESKNGLGYFTLTERQVVPSKRRDGSIREGYHDLVLGDPDRVKKVSYVIDAKTHKYGAVYMTVAEIKDTLEANRREWQRRHTVFFDGISDRVLHKRAKHDDGTKFYSIAISGIDDAPNGIGYFTLPEGLVIPSRRRDGTVVEGYHNLVLGNPDHVMKVSYAVKAGKYDTVSMTVAQIKEALEADRGANSVANSTEPAA